MRNPMMKCLAAAAYKRSSIMAVTTYMPVQRHARTREGKRKIRNSDVVRKHCMLSIGYNGKSNLRPQANQMNTYSRKGHAVGLRRGSRPQPK